MPPFHWGIRVKNHSDELILTEDLRGSLWTGGDKLPQRSFNACIPGSCPYHALKECCKGRERAETSIFGPAALTMPLRSVVRAGKGQKLLYSGQLPLTCPLGIP